MSKKSIVFKKLQSQKKNVLIFTESLSRTTTTKRNKRVKLRLLLITDNNPNKLRINTAIAPVWALVKIFHQHLTAQKQVSKRVVQAQTISLQMETSSYLSYLMSEVRILVAVQPVYRNFRPRYNELIWPHVGLRRYRLKSSAVRATLLL